jgi:cysteine desulfurase/selenocysteine lyase
LREAAPETCEKSRVTALDPDRVRADFPALAQAVHGRPLVYLDSASTAQKPRAVIEATVAAYTGPCANVHRGVHALSVEATDLYEGAREKVRRFLGAARADEIVFTRSATEALNLVAHSFGRTVVGPGDEVLVSVLEHHANLVPWQMLCAERGATLRAIPLDAGGHVDLLALRGMLSSRVKIVAVGQVSNAFGTIAPLAPISTMVRALGAALVVDGAQGAPHLGVDVRALDCDFYVFSGHKLHGPTGTGVLYGKRERLAAMPPWQGGGDMIRSVSFAGTTYADPPARFEAGTPNIAGVIGLGAALDYLEGLGREAIVAREEALLAYATAALGAVPGLRILGAAGPKTAIVSLTLAGIHPHDAGTILDREGIAVRTGHHCAQPAMDHFGVTGTVRASLSFYNTEAEIDALVRGLRLVQETFA